MATSTSRLIVRNLAPSCDEKQLRTHFSKHGEITDVKVMKTQGKSRCFAFVGFRTEASAQGAKKTLDRSYIGSTRINVDYAQVRGDQSSKGKTAPPPKTSLKQTGVKSKASNLSPNTTKETGRHDEMKNEFVSTMKKTAAMCWSNEEQTSSKVVESEKLNEESSDDGSDLEFDIPIQSSVEVSSSNSLASNKVLSDLDYLKAKSGLITSAISPEGTEGVNNVSSFEEGGNKKLKIKTAKTVVVVGEGGAGPSKITKTKKEEKVKSKDDSNKDSTMDSKIEKSDNEKVSVSEVDNSAGGEGGEGNDQAPPSSSSRLFVRNLPYSVEESELKALFNKHGSVSDVFIPVDELKRQKGFAFISFPTLEQAQAAQENLKEVIFQGRPLYISSAVDKHSHNPDGLGGGGGGGEISKDELSKLKTNGAYKQWKELERRKKAMETEGWNASHIRSDAVVDVITSRLNVNKSDFLDVNESNMAVRLAIGETHIIAENVDYFAKEGIDLNTLISKNASSDKHDDQTSSSSSQTKRVRSDRILLIKNIPSSTDVLELSNLFSKHGEIERFLLPPSKLVALVEFIDAKDARKAFKALAYKRYQNVPLYLEWAPRDAISEKKKTVKKRAKSDDSDSEDDSDEEEGEKDIIKSPHKKLKATFYNEDEDDSALVNNESTSIYVKNLSFQTKEQDLRNLFSQAHAAISVRNVFIPQNKSKKSSGDSTISLGYGFVEFADQASAELALTKLQGVVLDGKSLELKRSQKKLPVNGVDKASSLNKSKSDKSNEEGDEEDSDQPTRTKLLVKNVAFQTSMQEMRELFSTFGTLKSLSMPKKYDGRHRGFAFVDYVLPHEALEAKKQLSSSHFYGRHLIIQWANSDDDNGSVAAGSSARSSTLNKSKEESKLEKIRNKARKTVNASKVVAGMVTKKQKMGQGEDGFDEFGGGGRDQDED